MSESKEYPIFVAELLRWGEEDSHHYIVGASRCPALAACAAWTRTNHRGGKYAGVVFRVDDWECGVKEVWRHESCCG